MLMVCDDTVARDAGWYVIVVGGPPGVSLFLIVASWNVVL